MGEIKSLAKDTAYYGMSSILGKALNWLLTPLYTYTLSQADNGIMTNLFAWSALIIVMLTFGMETGLFRFMGRKDEYDPKLVYSTTLISVGSVVAGFLLLAILFIKPITGYIGNNIPQQFIHIMIWVFCMDAFSAIPFAYLRYQKRPIRFVTLKMLQIILFVVLNLFFLILCPWIHKNNPDLIAWFYNPHYGVGYVFVANLIATLVQTCCLIPELTGFRYRFDKELFQKMFKYSFPLLILGIAGILNQTVDKMIFPMLYPGADAMAQLGIYGSCFKIAMIMMMFTQAFRFAYEPFIFLRSGSTDNKKSYADAMKYFIIFGLLAFLGVMLYMDVVKYFIKPTFFEGLGVVPIVMMGALFFGIYFNLSLWYKLTDKTYWGAVFSIIGCVIIVALNVAFIPHYSYMACAWASFVGYLIIMILSYFFGQKYYPIKYDLKAIGLYFGLAVLLYCISEFVKIDNLYLRLGFRSLLFGIYLFVVIKKVAPLKKTSLL